MGGLQETIKEGYNLASCRIQGYKPLSYRLSMLTKAYKATYKEAYIGYKATCCKNILQQPGGPQGAGGF